MTTVLVSGWNVGFNKVKFTQLLQRTLGYSLGQAKRATDAVLEGGALELQVPDDESERLLSTMSALGAKCVDAVPVR